MDLQAAYQDLCLKEAVSPESVEQALDCEFTLPDYCPNIERVLKCRVTPKLSSCSVAGNSIMLEGTAYISIIYCSKNKSELCGYEMSCDFSKSVDTDADGEKLMLDPVVKLDYANCRAVTERKVDVHGAVTIKLNASKGKTASVMSDSREEHLQMMKRSMEAVTPIGSAEKLVTIKEEFELSSANGSLQNIIKYCCTAHSEECKFVANKAIVKGVIKTKVLYCSNDNNYERVEFSLPFNQIIDINGADEDSLYTVSLDVCSCSLKPHTNADGEIRSIIATIKTRINLCVSQAKQVDIITDAYSTYCEIDQCKAMGEFESAAHTVHEELTAKQQFDFSEEVLDKIIDVECRIESVSCKSENNGVTVSGKLNAEIITMNSDGECMYFEKAFGFEKTFPTETDAKLLADIRASVTDCSYNIGGAGLEIRAIVMLHGNIMQCYSGTYITEIIPDETRLKSNDDAPAMVIYYADEGESIWEIAIRYNTSPELIRQLNSLTGETLSADKMLIIPSM